MQRTVAGYYRGLFWLAVLQEHHGVHRSTLCNDLDVAVDKLITSGFCSMGDTSHLE